MVDRTAKWRNILTEEARTTVGQVSIPHETAQELMRGDYPTPGEPQSKINLTLPKIITSPIDLVTAGPRIIGSYLFGSQQEFAETTTGLLLPLDVEQRKTELPDYKVDWININTDIGELPSVILPSSVKYSTEEGNVEILTPGDINTTTETIPFGGEGGLIHEVIEEQKLSPEFNLFWTAPASNIEIPNPFEGFGKITDILKWALIGGGALLGLYILSKFVGGKKK